MAKFTKIPETTFQEIQLNAGVILSTFDPETKQITLGDILAATSDGVEFNAEVEYTDFGEDIDNCPKNTKELKKLESYEITLSGDFATINAELAKRLIGAADVAGKKITPRNDIKAEDFADLWWVGDYSDKNDEADGGCVAIHMLNTLSTGGFSLKSEDKEKGKFAFEFTAHYSIAEQTKVPFEVYIEAGGAVV